MRKSFEKIGKGRWGVSFLLLLTLNWFMLSCFMKASEAATSLVGIELFTNQASTNDSNSTYQAPLIFDGETVSHEIEFSVTGQALANVDVLNSQKQVVLVIPDELVGKVQPNGEARIEVDVLLSEDAPIIGGLLGTISRLLGSVLDIIGLVSPLAKQISALLDRLFNLGRLTYTAEIIDHGTYLVIDYETGLVRAILDNLQGVVNELKDILNGLGLLGVLVLALLSPLTIAIDKLLAAITNPTAELVDSLANASVLSNTEVIFPTVISNQGDDLYGDANGVSTQVFYMSIVQAELIEVNLFKGSASQSQVYLQAKPTEQETTIALPTNLNFGKHDIQTLRDEKWVATATGNQLENPVKGSVVLLDTTSSEKNWEIKVKQISDWKNNSTTLGNPTLKLFGGTLEYSGFAKADINYAFSTVGSSLDLTLNSEQKILELTSSDARGQIEFDIDKFELIVPKNNKKNEGIYQADFIWTASDSP